MSRLAKINQFNRSGSVHYRVIQREDGETAVSISVDFERVPEPEHSYLADYFEVYRADADVVMVFGKKDYPSETELRNKIEIYFPFDPFVQQLWQSTRGMQQSLQETFDKKGKVAKRPGDLVGPVAKVQTLTANNALVVNSGGQCVIDFFLIPVKDLWIKTRKGDPLNVSAIVRVFVSQQILLGFLKCCDEIADVLKNELDIPVGEEENEDLESFEL